MDVTSPPSTPGPPPQGEGKRKERAEQALSVIHYLLRETQEDRLTWESYSRGSVRGARAMAAGAELMLGRQGGTIYLWSRKGEEEWKPLFPSYVYPDVQGSLRDLERAIRFQQDAPSDEFSDLLRIATEGQTENQTEGNS